MRFEKWQALGNDYVIVEAADLPAPLTSAAVRALCDRHTGIGADGLLLLEPPDDPAFVAQLRIFNPDGSEAELSGNGAREAIMYLRHRGWTDRAQFSIQTVAADAGVAVAERPHRARREQRGQVGGLDDDVVVAERLPLLEAHVGREPTAPAGITGP